jgi:regulator of sigma E protease
MTTAFAFVLLLSTLIFVHELGHFLVAKACGVRVLKFSLGFGPAIGIGRHRLSWTRGHTEYVVAWFPLGGFVKMLGESLEEMGDPEMIAHPEETLNGRPTWQKLAIVFAGPAMNLLLPVVVFMATLAVGMPRPLPVIGTIEPASPAEQAGLRPGDLITAAGGVPVEWWEDFDEVVRGRADAPLQVAYERDGEPAVASLEIVARSSFDPFGKVVSVGWAGADHPRLSAVLGVPDSSSPAALAGLHSGDRVEAVGGAPIETWQELANAYAAAQGGVELSLRRGADEEAPTLELTVPALGSVEALGVIPANVLVAGVDAEKPAGRAGLAAGDLILSVDGEPVGSFASFAETVRTSEGRPLRLAFAREGTLREVTIAPEIVEVDAGLGIKEPRYLVGITADPASLRGAVGIEREVNPVVALPLAVGMTVDVTRTFLQGLGKIVTGEVSRKQIAGPIGIAEIAGNAFERGWETYLSIMVLISVNLGILNLLPIPILDGGQAVIFTLEAIKRGPLSLRTREIFQQIGLTVLVLLMGLAFWNDLSRNWSRLVDWLAGSGL